MTLVRATASLPDLDTGQEADVDSWDPRWANRIASGLVVVVGDVEPDATVPLMPPPPPDDDAAAVRSPLEEAVRERNIEETLDLVESGHYTAGEVLAAERAAKNRTGVVSVLSGQPARFTSNDVDSPDAG